jgi:hypothetical protein
MGIIHIGNIDCTESKPNFASYRQRDSNPHKTVFETAAFTSYTMEAFIPFRYQFNLLECFSYLFGYKEVPPTGFEPAFSSALEAQADKGACVHFLIFLSLSVG